MEEYEYSFNVKDIKPYLEYCEQNGYQKSIPIKQNRVVYENVHSNKIVARITTTEVDGEERIVFDCKSTKDKLQDLKVSQESKEIWVTKENKEGILSMLETLGFYVSANNTRIRYVYKKDAVVFEIDDYIEPKHKVVAIEGDKTKVDAIYSIIKSLECEK